jgi:hypothetical protein
MTLPQSANQRPGTRRRHPTETEHDTDTSTRSDASEAENELVVHDGEHRKGASLWSRFVYVPGCRFRQSLRNILPSRVQCLPCRNISGALPVWTTTVYKLAPQFPRWVAGRRRACTSPLVLIVHLTVVASFLFCYPATRRQQQHHRRRFFRPATDQELDRLPITLPSSSSFSKLHWPLHNLFNTTLKTVDYGGIEINSLLAGRYRREIQADDHERFERERDKLLHEDEYDRVPFAYWHQEELSGMRTACRRPSWVEYQFPTCNDFHHVDLTQNYDETLARLAGDEQDYDNYYINRGFYRDVWVNMKPAVDTRFSRRCDTNMTLTIGIITM